MSSCTTTNNLSSSRSILYEKVYEDVTQVVLFYSMKTAHIHDQTLPTIPAPFQTIIIMFKFIWYSLFELIFYIFSARFINEEKIICSFRHWIDFHKEKYFEKKVTKTKYTRMPYFIEYRDHMYG